MSDGRDPLQALAVRWGAAGYLVAILGTEILTMLLGAALWQPGRSIEVVQLIVYVTGLALGLVLWRHCPARSAARGLLRVFLALALALWVLEAGRQWVAGVWVNPVWLAVPLLLILVWRKPPAPVEATAVITGMAVVVLGSVAVALALEVAGVAQSWYTVTESEVLRAGDRATYWLPLAGPLGLEGRWAGPFPHPNMAGPVGGLLIVVGMCRRGWLQASLLVGGFAVLLLTSSRTSIVGALAAVIVVVLASLVWDRPRSRVQWSVLVGTPAALVLMLAQSLTYTGTTTSLGVSGQLASATGRSTIWPVYADLWLDSPWTGVPDAVIQQAIAAGRLPAWAEHAHNLGLDSLVRFGILGALLVVGALVVAGLLAVRAAAGGVRVGIGLLFVVVGCALTESLVFWRLWAISTIILFLAVIASVGPYPPARWRGRSPTQPEPISSAAD